MMARSSRWGFQTYRLWGGVQIILTQQQIQQVQQQMQHMQQLFQQ